MPEEWYKLKGLTRGLVPPPQHLDLVLSHPSSYVWSQLGHVIFPGQAPKYLAEECIGLKVGELQCKEVLTSSEDGNTQDGLEYYSMPALICREYLSSSGEEDDNEGIEASEEDSDEDIGPPPLAPPRQALHSAEGDSKALATWRTILLMSNQMWRCLRNWGLPSFLP
jgi:hypothetical protein